MNLSISAVIPVYNGQRFLREAVDSILKQTMPVQEIVLVNDGSKDNSQALMQEIAENSPIPVKIAEQENSGVSAARNLGLITATSDLIAFLDVDDLWLPTKIEKQLALYSQFASEDLYTFTNYCMDTEDKTKLSASGLHEVCLAEKYDREAFQSAFIQENFIGTASTNMFSRKLALKIGGFNARLNHSEDFDFALRYSQHAEVRLLHEPLLMKRTHGENLTGNPKLHYWSHIAALKLNIGLNSAFSRANYSRKIVDQMNYSQDIYTIRLCNEIYEESPRKGLYALYKGLFKVKTSQGGKEHVKAMARKLIRTLSLGTIKRKNMHYD